MLAVLVGLSLAFISYRCDYKKLKNYGFAALIISFFFLISVFIPGIEADYGKAHNWINVFGFSLQPAELVKLSFLIYLAAWLEVKKDKLRVLKDGFIPFIIVLVPITFLMLSQPDLGSFLIIAGISFFVYFLAGGPWRDIIATVLLAIIMVTLVVFAKTNKMERIDCYINPQLDSQGTCYQVNQALIAVGSGGFFGLGFGESRQKSMYLPEVWSDSIFAVVAEEFGFLGSLILLSLYFFLFYRGIMIARQAPDDFGRFMAGGISFWIFFQAFVNLGGAINLIPLTGVPLPFFSSGGTSIMVLLAVIGILLNISRQRKSLKKYE
jgi:cell division protein FtsW